MAKEAKYLDITCFGTDYKLQFNRETASKCGVTKKDLEHLEDDPHSILTLLPKLFYGALLMHQPRMTRPEADNIWQELGNKDENLIEALITLYCEPLETLFDEGNGTWTKNW